MKKAFRFATVGDHNNWLLDKVSKCPCCDKFYLSRFWDEKVKLFKYKHSFFNRKLKVTTTIYHESLR